LRRPRSRGCAFANGLVSASLLQLAAGAGIAGTYMPGLRALTDNVSGTGAQSRAVSFYTAVFGLGTSLSILLSGWIAGAMGFRWAFGLGAAGPLAAALWSRWAAPRKPTPLHGARMLDFRPVLASGEVRPYIFGYAVHCWELFGSRSWLVAFIVFAQQLQVSGGAAPAHGPRSRSRGRQSHRSGGEHRRNELAMRRGRERLIWMAMLASGALTCALVSPPRFRRMRSWPWSCCTCASSWRFFRADAGLVTRIDERIRGAAMAVHSMLGFARGSSRRSCSEPCSMWPAAIRARSPGAWRS